MRNFSSFSYLFFVFIFISLQSLEFVFSYNSSLPLRPTPPTDHKLINRNESKLIYANHTFVQEIKTNSEFQDLLKYLVSPNKISKENQPLLTNSFGHTLNMSLDDEVYIVIFYAVWCPHCHQIAPTYSNLANLFHCTRGIRFFAFECSLTNSDRVGPDGVSPHETCRTQSINGFPTIKAYWPKRLGHSQLIGTEEVKNSDTEEFSTAHHVVSASKKASPPPIDSEKSIDEIVFNVVRPFSSENPKDKNFTAEILLRQSVEVNQRSVVEFQKWIISTTPILKVQKCILSSDKDLFSVNTNGTQSEKITWESIRKGGLESRKRWSQEVHEACPDTRLYDALSGFLYLLRNWVITSDSEGLTKKINADLKHLIRSLVVLLPGSNIQLSLKQFYDALSIHSTMTSKEYHLLIDSLQLGGLRALPIGQSPALLHAPRLTSAIWLLFHTMAVSLYSQSHLSESFKILSKSDHSCQTFINSQIQSHHLGLRTGNQLRSENEQQQGSAHQYPNLQPITSWTVAKSIRTTVSSFFACEICRVHFITFFDRCYAHLCDWVGDSINSSTQPSADSHFVLNNSDEGLLLWLWRFHNAVTFRTAVERTAESVVTLQELELKKNDNSHGALQVIWCTSLVCKSLGDKLVSYEGEDVRFPPVQLCPSCRHPLSVVLKNENATSRLPTGNTNSTITMDALIVSHDLIQNAAKVERMMRGINSSDLEESQLFKELNDSTWDRIEDFDLKRVEEFLIRYSWKAEWIGLLGNLMWDNNKRLFIVSQDTSGRRLVSDAKGVVLDSTYTEDAVKQNGNNQLVEDLSSAKKRELAKDVPVALLLENILPAQNNPVQLTPEDAFGFKRNYSSIGTAGGLFGLFSLSSLLLFVAYAKIKRGTSSLSHGFYRTIGLRHHLKRDHLSPKDAELGSPSCSYSSHGRPSISSFDHCNLGRNMTPVGGSVESKKRYAVGR